MKKAFCSTLTTALVSLTLFTAGLGFARVATATLIAQSSTYCTPDTCTSYRANYERAIARGIISRPSLVSDQYQAIRLADRAIEQGNLSEATCRYAQALVIISETEGNEKALSVERSLDAEFQERQGKTLRQFLPLFSRIFPLAGNPYN